VSGACTASLRWQGRLQYGAGGGLAMAAGFPCRGSSIPLGAMIIVSHPGSSMTNRFAIERRKSYCARIAEVSLRRDGDGGAAALRLIEALKPDWCLLGIPNGRHEIGIARAHALNGSAAARRRIFVTGLTNRVAAPFDPSRQ